MGPCDHLILAHEPRYQLITRRRSPSVVNVKDHRNVAMAQLDKLHMNGVAPEQAMSLYAQLVGALVISRAVVEPDAALADEVLESIRVSAAIYGLFHRNAK